MTSLRKLVKLAEEGNQLDNPKIREALRAASLDASLAESLEEYLSFEASKKLASGDPFYPLPSEKEIEGRYKLGKCGSATFGLNDSELLQHVLIVGRSGSGKTNCSFLLLKELMRNEKPFLVFDWKRNYRELLAHEDDVLVFTVGRNVCPFRFNPLIPPEGTEPEVWLKRLIEIMSHAFFLGEGVVYILHKAIDSLYEDYGVYEGSEKYPTMLDVYEYLQNYKARGREVGWLTSSKRAVQELCFGEMGSVLNTESRMQLEDLLKRNVILELDALTSTDKTFFIEALLLFIHHLRLAEEEKEKLKHSIIIEEAHHILLRKKQQVGGGEAITDVIMREIRELGESLVIIDQHPSLISKPALGNTYTSIAMNLKSRSDVNSIGNSICLNRNQKAALTNLDIGEGIVKLQGRYTDPFPVKFPLVEIEKGSVSDDMLKQEMSRFYAKWPGFRPDSSKSEEFRTSSENYKVKSEGKMPDLKDRDLKLLKSIAENPPASVSKCYRRAGLNSYQGNEAKKELKKNGLIEEENIAKKDGYVKVMDVSEKGYKVLRENGFEIGEPREMEGSITHRYWKHRIADYYQKLGYETSVEEEIENGKYVDVVAERDMERIAIEISASESDEAWNVRKDLDAGFNEVKVFCVNEEIARKVEEQLEEAGLQGEATIALPGDFE